MIYAARRRCLGGEIYVDATEFCDRCTFSRITLHPERDTLVDGKRSRTFGTAAEVVAAFERVAEACRGENWWLEDIRGKVNPAGLVAAD